MSFIKPSSWSSFKFSMPQFPSTQSFFYSNQKLFPLFQKKVYAPLEYNKIGTQAFPNQNQTNSLIGKTFWSRKEQKNSSENKEQETSSQKQPENKRKPSYISTIGVGLVGLFLGKFYGEHKKKIEDILNEIKANIREANRNKKLTTEELDEVIQLLLPEAPPKENLDEYVKKFGIEKKEKSKEKIFQEVLRIEVLRNLKSPESKKRLNEILKKTQTKNFQTLSKKTADFIQKNISEKAFYEIYLTECFYRVLEECKAGNWGKVKNIDPNYLPRLKQNGLTLYLQLIIEGDLNIIKDFKNTFNSTWLVSHVRDEEGNTPLHIAIMEEHDQLIKIIAKKSSCFETNNKGKTAFELAIEKGNPQCLNEILQLAPINLSDKDFTKYLSLAVEEDETDCFHLLLCQEKNKQWKKVLDALTQNGNTVLHQAVKNGSKEITEYLLTTLHKYTIGYINDHNEENLFPIHIAVKKDNQNMVQFLALKGANVNSTKGRYGKSCLDIAVENLSAEMIKRLFSLDAELKNEEVIAHLRKIDKLKLDPKIEPCIHNLEEGATEAEKAFKSLPNYFKNPPTAITFKGGGAAGLAYAGAWENLEKQGLLKDLRYVFGTSAGAIMASLVASGHSANDIQNLLLKKNFEDLLNFKNPKDKTLIANVSDDIAKGSYLEAFEKILKGYVTERLSDLSGKKAREFKEKLFEFKGYADPTPLREWIDVQIEKKTGKKECTFKELEDQINKAKNKQFKNLVIFAVVGDEQNIARIVEFSAEKTPKVVISSAVVASAAIPGVIEPEVLHVKESKSKKTARYHSLGPHLDGAVAINNPLKVADRLEFQNKEGWGTKTNKRALALCVTANNPLTKDDTHINKDDTPIKINFMQFIKTIWNAQDIYLDHDPTTEDRTLKLPVSCKTLDFLTMETKEKEKVIEEGRKAATLFVTKEREKK